MRWLSLSLVLVVCLLEAAALLPCPPPAPLLVELRPASLAPPGLTDAGQAVAATSGGAVFLARLTADDVARGIWALSDDTAEALPALNVAQRQHLATLLRRGGELHQQLGALREARRAQRRQVLESAAQLALLVGSTPKRKAP